ncbi:hypothetical protein BGAL_0317g00060 [Botrytis galanthina]|uniref:Uncharacterized protein n=1 Tax=Botrytis galanthina TaxID=278940 RepID=A0A4S8QRE7_9HELO|nr:hypothetical protein BGAL_0317g00060 [Botrytis galanthina]
MGVLINQRYNYQIILPYSEEALKALTVLQEEEDARGEGGVVVRGAAGDWRLETGDWRLETGDWRLKTQDSRLKTQDSIQSE